MQTRTTLRTITFRRSFILDGFDRQQPAGNYTVETEEEVIGSATVPAYRHIGSTFVLNATGSRRRHFPFDPQDLVEALERDRLPSGKLEYCSPGAWRGMDRVRRNRAG